METNFENLSPEIQKHGLIAQQLLNSQSSEFSPEKQTAGFVVDGETAERKVCFKLVESDDGTTSYVFDYLAWWGKYIIT